MGVYVDESYPVQRNKNWPYNEACHMVADTVKELHTFARRLSLKRSWFQPRSIPHYDLTPNKRAQALRLGAIAITDRRLVEIIHKHREALKGGD